MPAIDHSSVVGSNLRPTFKMAELKNLPPELWLHIFTYAPYPDLVSSIRTCRSFAYLIGPLAASLRWEFILEEEQRRYRELTATVTEQGFQSRQYMGCRKCSKLLPRTRFPVSRKKSRICISCHVKSGDRRPQSFKRWVDVNSLERGREEWVWRWCEKCEKYVLYSVGGYAKEDVPVEGWHEGATEWSATCQN